MKLSQGELTDLEHAEIKREYIRAISRSLVVNSGFEYSTAYMRNTLRRILLAKVNEVPDAPFSIRTRGGVNMVVAFTEYFKAHLEGNLER